MRLTVEIALRHSQRNFTQDDRAQVRGNRWNEGGWSDALGPPPFCYGNSMAANAKIVNLNAKLYHKTNVS